MKRSVQMIWGGHVLGKFGPDRETFYIMPQLFMNMS
jgi:hypothetical protein